MLVPFETDNFFKSLFSAKSCFPNSQWGKKHHVLLSAFWSNCLLCKVCACFIYVPSHQTQIQKYQRDLFSVCSFSLESQVKLSFNAVLPYKKILNPSYNETAGENTEWNYWNSTTNCLDLLAFHFVCEIVQNPENGDKLIRFILLESEKGHVVWIPYEDMCSFNFNHHASKHGLSRCVVVEKLGRGWKCCGSSKHVVFFPSANGGDAIGFVCVLFCASFHVHQPSICLGFCQE